MLCVIFNSAAAAGAGPLMAARWGGAAQEEKRSPTKTIARNPKLRSFTRQEVIYRDSDKPRRGVVAIGLKSLRKWVVWLDLFMHSVVAKNLTPILYVLRCDGFKAAPSEKRLCRNTRLSRKTGDPMRSGLLLHFVQKR